MAVAIRVESRPTFRDLHNQRFAKAERELLENKRRMMRPEAARLRDILQDEAPKKSGEFAKNIRFKTYVRAAAVGFTISMPKPLSDYIIKGTRPHPITPKRPGYPLRFFWEKMGKVVFFYSVNHPGTKPNPFDKRAHKRWKPGARRTLARISTRYIDTLKGK